MTAKEVVAGVGARYAEAFRIDQNTGLPGASFNSGTLTTGTLIDRLKGFTYNSPEPQAFTHYGDDRPFAKDSLPPTEIGNFTVITAVSNLALDAFADGTKQVTLDSVVQAHAGNTDNRGSEPQNFISVFRQALDTKRGSATFGKLRQWHSAVIPSARLITHIQSMEQGITNKSYTGIPTPVTLTPWAQAFDSATWGGTQAEYVELVTDYKPNWCFGLGNGTLTRFALPKPPIDAAHTHVWVNGTLATVSSVSTSSSSPAVTLSAAPGGPGSGGLGPNGEAFVAVLLEHNQPN